MNTAVQLSHAILRGRYLRCFRLFTIGVVIILCPCSAISQTSTDQEKLLRFDVTPLVGYRTIMSFPTVVNSQGPSPHLILDARPSYGIAAGVRLDEEDVIEFRWARQNTRVHLEGAPSSSNDVVFDQFHGDFTHEYILDKWPRSVRPFVIGSVGATHVGGASGSFTRFSFGLGTGIKYLPSRHFGLRVQGEWLPVVINPEVNAFICGGGCVVHLSGTIVSQGEFAAGPIFRF